jgi:hypothetical protein
MPSPSGALSGRLCNFNKFPSSKSGRTQLSSFSSYSRTICMEICKRHFIEPLPTAVLQR